MIDPVPYNRHMENLPVSHRQFAVILRSWLGKPTAALTLAQIDCIDPEDEDKLGTMAFLKMANYIQKGEGNPWRLDKRGIEWIKNHEDFLKSEDANDTVLNTFK